MIETRRLKNVVIFVQTIYQLKLRILRKKQNQKVQRKKQEKDVLKNLYNLFKDRERLLNAFDSKIFPMKIEGTGFSGHSNLKILTGFSGHSNLKILTPKHMLQKLSIALT